MPPRAKETTQLLDSSHVDRRTKTNGEGPMEILASQGSFSEKETTRCGFWSNRKHLSAIVAFMGVFLFVFVIVDKKKLSSLRKPVGPYKLLECQEGNKFFDYYNFYDGPDSLGSAGYNTYVGKAHALDSGLANVTTRGGSDESFVFLKSAPTHQGPRESIRLEGKRRYDRGLFILDLAHMPAGCGVWPAFWLTDESNWPDNGEIDIVEGVNYQSVAKTALHTSESCSMYAHVPTYGKTGVWDSATGIPDSWTGKPDYNTKVEADNCWVMAPHQWANQGCVAVSTENGTIGAPLNANGGGVYTLEWDPANGYIKSWVFPRGKVPSNLERTMRTANSDNTKERIVPDPGTWGLPYGYFAIGEDTGCSSDHFKNMRIVFNLAFCGTVSGNRFFRDCPYQAKSFKIGTDPIKSCNAWIASNPSEMDEAYWKIRGVYVYERDWARMTTNQKDSSSQQGQTEPST